jgi:hypothetical protein
MGWEKFVWITNLTINRDTAIPIANGYKMEHP